MNLTITSEVGQLQAVIVHTPGHEVSLVNPEIKDELLFDDIIFEEDARGEHQDMLQMFKSGMPASGSIFEITDLMIEAFSDENARGYIVEQLIKSLPEENLAMVEKEILKLNPAGLSAFLITGAAGLEGSFCLPPSPNLLFTRDLAAVVGSTIIVSRAAKKVRMRESLIMETLVKYHPLFAPVKEMLFTCRDTKV